MSSLAAALLLGAAGCATGVANRSSRTPAAPLSTEPAMPCLVLIGAAPHLTHWCDGGVRRELRGAVTKGLVDSGRFRVLETEVVTPLEPSIHEARSLARRVGAERLALLRLQHLELRTQTHHVRRYHDASATGELVLVDVESGAIERAARQTVHLSTRARYATTSLARDLLVTRLAHRLTAEALVETPR